MKINYFFVLVIFLSNLNAMGLRSFVALPGEKDGVVVRVQNLYTKETINDTLATSFAYGINAKQTILIGIPYRLNPKNKRTDVSLIYRYIVSQNDAFHGTSRFALLGGVLIPTKNSDAMFQTGSVYTYFYDRHEVDIDIVYKFGLRNLQDKAQYDISWQYRLFPSIRNDWGISKELNFVGELNGRWIDGSNMTQQVTIGLQLIYPKLVLEGGVTKDLNNQGYRQYILSIRTHF